MFCVRGNISVAILVATILLPTFAVSGTLVNSTTDYHQGDPSQAEGQVTITFTAVDKNKSVTTLKKDDIRLSADGVTQEIRNVRQQTDRPASIAILIDTSASQETLLAGAKLAAQAFLETVVSSRDQVAVVTFAEKETIQQPLTRDRNRLRAAIGRAKFDPPPGYTGGGVIIKGPSVRQDHLTPGSTAIWDTLWMTCENIFISAEPNTRHAIILFSDGEDSSSKLKMKTVVERAIRDDVAVFSIGIADQRFGSNKAVLKQLSDRTGGRAFFPKSGDDVNNIFLGVNEELRSQYSVTFTPNDKSSHNPFHKVRIELSNPELRKMELHLAYRDGYYSR